MGTHEGIQGNDGSAAERVERAVLFADIADSTRLFREHGDVRARELLVAALALGRRAVEAAGGRVVETIGDELFCELPDASAALTASVGMHEALLAARVRRELPAGLAFRVGLAEGPVGLDGEHLYGDTVYLAKRVSTSAKAEQILTTGASLARMTLPQHLHTRLVDVIRLKGRADEVDLVEIVWTPDATLDALDAPRARTPRRASSTRALRVSHDGSTRTVGAETPTLRIGRGESADLCVDDVRVSRLHARIELRRDGFALIDMSRNGCLLQADDEPPRTLLRAEAALGAAGEIRLGPDADAPLLRYATHDAEA